MTELFEIKRGDRMPAFRARCLDGTDPVDLSSATEVRFIMRDAAGVVVNAVAARENQTTAKGWVNYAWAAADTDTAGVFNAEIEVTWPVGLKQTFPANRAVRIRILSDLA